MAVSRKSSRLGLSIWSETDKPERADFVSDNEKLEELVGTHVNSNSLHLTTTEKELIKKPFNSYVYSGDGKSTKTYYLPFAPTFVFVFATGKPQGVYESELYSVFSAMQLGNYKMAGISLKGTEVTMQQQTVTQAKDSGTGYRLRLNESGLAYCIIAIR